MVLRTRIYIDGFNLYYGCLWRTPYKWLDLIALFEREILPSVLYRPTPEALPVDMQLDPCAIRYFTAPILGRAAKGVDSVRSQAAYHAALSADPRISITKGYYALARSIQYVIDADDPNKPPRQCARLPVWKLEEKQSDVNLALSLYEDALSGELDQLVVVTNDTDIAPALARIRKQCPKLVIGLVIPTRRDAHPQGQPKEREPNVDLCQHADWTRSCILSEELARAQLPRVVQGGRKAVGKPLSWFARPDLLQAAMLAAQPIRSKPHQFFQWAEAASAHLDGQRPIDLLGSDAGAARVMAYIEHYIRDHQQLGVAA